VATNMRRFLFILLTSALVLSFSMCKQSSTAPDLEVPPESDISVTCTPVSGGIGTVFTVSITIGSIDKEIKVFGMEMTFEANLIQFQGANEGNLTGNWAAVDANEIRTGTLRIGGFAGSGTAIPARSKGTIAEIRLKVLGGDFNDGQKSQICINSYTDDISGLTPSQACTSFELKK